MWDESVSTEVYKSLGHLTLMAQLVQSFVYLQPKINLKLSGSIQCQTKGR